VEFASTQAAKSFVPPAWFGEEVTEDSRYNNVSLALYGVPVHQPKARRIRKAA
jgi:adenylate cyclase